MLRAPRQHRQLSVCALAAVSAALVQILVIGAAPPVPATTSAPSAASAPSDAACRKQYRYRENHDPDGIGKFYMGREIAHVMGHEGADWLDRPEREIEERPSRLVELLELRPGSVVADIGAGTGYITMRLAEAVGRTGRVKAVDVQPEMLDLLRERLRRRRIRNVDLILGRADDPELPERSLDLALFVDVYHELEWPCEVMRHVVRALKPGGRVVLVEYRLEDPDVPIKRLHKMSEAQAIREMRAAGLQHERTLRDLPRQHVLIFTRAATPYRCSGLHFRFVDGAPSAGLVCCRGALSRDAAPRSGVPGPPSPASEQWFTLGNKCYAW